MLKMRFLVNIFLVYTIHIAGSVTSSSSDYISMRNKTDAFYITEGSHDASMGYNWPVLGLAIFSVSGILGNLLVCVTIIRDQKLQTKTNYFLFSLAIADLAVCVIVIPLSTIQDFLDVWMFGKLGCTFWIFADILLCTCSIYHLTTVSILRFIAIQFPLTAKQTTSSLMTFVNIFVIWSVSIFLSSSVIYLGYVDPSNVMGREIGTIPKCYLRNKTLIIYGSIFAFVIPLIIMKLMFFLTVRKLRIQMLKLDGNAAQYSAASVSEVGSDYEVSQGSRNRRHHEVQLRRHKSYHSREIQTDQRILCCFSNSNSDIDSESNIKRPNPVKSSSKKIRTSHSSEYMRSELKALKVLGIVFIAFIIAWLPFCLMNFILVIYDGDQYAHLAEFLNYFTYLGYISSTFNPIIYTAFNKRFRQNFFEILQCRKRGQKRKHKPVIAVRV